MCNERRPSEFRADDLSCSVLRKAESDSRTLILYTGDEACACSCQASSLFHFREHLLASCPCANHAAA